MTIWDETSRQPEPLPRAARCQIHPGEKWLDCDQLPTETREGIRVCAFHAARLDRWIAAGRPSARASIDAMWATLAKPTPWDNPPRPWQHIGSHHKRQERVPGSDDE